MSQANSKPRSRTRLMAVGVLLLLAVASLLLMRSRQSHASALSTACTWANVLPPPSKADVETSGSMLTREFLVTFHASPAEIDAWLASSQGTAGVTPLISGSEEHYTCKVQPNAQGKVPAFAEVRVDRAKGFVTIRTYWS